MLASLTKNRGPSRGGGLSCASPDRDSRAAASLSALVPAELPSSHSEAVPGAVRDLTDEDVCPRCSTIALDDHAVLLCGGA